MKDKLLEYLDKYSFWNWGAELEMNGIFVIMGEISCPVIYDALEFENENSRMEIELDEIEDIRLDDLGDLFLVLSLKSGALLTFHIEEAEETDDRDEYECVALED